MLVIGCKDENVKMPLLEVDDMVMDITHCNPRNKVRRGKVRENRWRLTGGFKNSRSVAFLVTIPVTTLHVSGGRYTNFHGSIEIEHVVKLLLFIIEIQDKGDEQRAYH